MNMLLYGVISLLFTIVIIPPWVLRARKRKLVSKDMHKNNKTAVELGGVCVISGFLIGVMAFVGQEVFFNQSDSHIAIFALLCSVLIATFIGLIDDILGWKIGLRKWHKVLLTLLAALPLVVLNIGESIMQMPFVGPMDLGLLFPLVLVPIAIIGSSNGFNMIAGFNGLEAGMGILIISTLGFFSFLQQELIAAVLAITMVGALIGFLCFNWYPAKIFPGDCLTYPVGTLIAIIAIVGNIEKFALILFIPYFIEVALKSRGFLQKESFGKLQEDGSLTKRYKKWYGLEHIMISFWEHSPFKSTEKKVVLSLYGIECCFIVLACLSFFKMSF